MTSYFQRVSFYLIVAVLLLGSDVASAAPATIISSDFTYGFGAEISPAGWPADTWTGAENAGTNSPTTQGLFTFTPTPAGAAWDSSGATFSGLTLATAGAGQGSAELLGSFATTTTLDIVGSYTGPVPGDAHPTTPDYKLQIQIDNVSIYASANAGGSSPALAIDETTSGHTGTSGAITLTGGIFAGLHANAAAYQQVAWNPGDYEVSLAGLNDPFTRSFDFDNLTDVTQAYGDGMEVTGRVILSYEQVPEPSTAVLALTVAVIMLPLRAAPSRSCVDADN